MDDNILENGILLLLGQALSELKEPIKSFILNNNLKVEDLQVSAALKFRDIFNGGKTPPLYLDVTFFLQKEMTLFVDGATIDEVKEKMKAGQFVVLKKGGKSNNEHTNN